MGRSRSLSALRHVAVVIVSFAPQQRIEPAPKPSALGKDRRGWKADIAELRGDGSGAPYRAIQTVPLPRCARPGGWLQR